MRRRRILGFMGLALALAAGLLLRSGSREKPRSVILISMDTVRADATEPYGSSLGATPNLARLARDSETWAEAYCPQTWTLTSHMSIWTSLYPEAQGLGSGNRALPPDVPTLPRLLLEGGYRTAGFVHQAFFLAGWYGFERGMQVYRETPQNAMERTRDALAWAHEHRHEKLFLFVHYYDAHSSFERLPYGGAGDWLKLYPPASEIPEAELRACYPPKFLLHALLGLAPLTPSDLRILRSLYDSGVRSVDAALGELLAGLREDGILDDALVIVVSDHGEEFLEHGALIHEQPYDEVRRVVCLLRYPERRGRVRSESTSNVDLLPTILDWAGLAKPKGLQGVSLLGDELPAGRVLTALGISPQTAVWSRRESLLHQEAGGYGRTFSSLDRDHFFELLEDPGERIDRLPSRQARAEALREALATRQRLDGLDTREHELSDEDREKLERFGYFGH